MSTSSIVPWKLTIVESHPIQYKAPLFRRLEEDPRFDLTVLYAMIPNASQQAGTFGVPFQWDVPLLEGYRYKLLENRSKAPSMSRFNGCDTPGIYRRLKDLKPDAVLVNGWVVKTCIQALVACRRLKIPCMVRGESNLLPHRVWWKHVLHELLLTQYSAYLSIGSASRAFYRFHHRSEAKLFHTPYSVDNDFFSEQASGLLSKRSALREAFGVPRDAVVFAFVGKLERKKRPLGLLRALSALASEKREGVHLLVAGDGPLMDECVTFVENHRLPVTFTGFLNQSRLPEVYVASDVLVLPSDPGETWASW